MQPSFLALLICPLIVTAVRAQNTLPDDPSDTPIVCAFPNPQIVSIEEVPGSDITLDTTMTTGGINGIQLRTPYESFGNFSPFESYWPDGDRTDQDVDDPEIVVCEGTMIVPSVFSGEYGDDFRGTVNTRSDLHRDRIHEDASGTSMAASSSGAAGSGPDIR